MAVAKILSSDIAKEIVKGAGNLIKNKDKIELKKAEDLLSKEKKKIKVDNQKVNVTKDGQTESVVKVDTKVKKPDVEPIEAQDILLKYNATKLTPKVLSDFNIKNMKSEKDILKFIELISKKYSGDIKNRTRGVMDHAQTKKFADVIGRDPKGLTQTLLRLKPGDTLNAEYMLAARELLAAGMARLDEMAQLVTKDGGMKTTAAMQLEFRQHFALMSEFQKIVKGVQTETARTLQSMRIPTRTKQFTNVNIDELNKSDLIIQMGGKDEITNLATLYIRSGTAGSTSRLKFNTDTGGFLNLKKVSDSIAEIFLNSILSAPATHVRNIAGNWVAQGIIQVERKLAQKLYSDVPGSGIAAYEDVAAAYGTSMANQEMWMALSTRFKEKGGLMKIIKNFDELAPATHGGNKVEMHGEKLTGTNFNIKNKVVSSGVDLLGNLLTAGRIPTKLLSSSDNVFKNRQYRAALFTHAYREAMENYHKGSLTFDDMSAFIAHRVDTPTSTMTEAAKKEMAYSVFQTKAADRGDALGKLAKMAQDLKGSGGGYMTWLTNYYIPFTQTPINIAGFVAERTPGLANVLTNYNKKVLAGGPEAAMAKARYRLGMSFYMAAIATNYGVSQLTDGEGQRADPLLMGGADLDIPGKATGGKTEMMGALGFEANSIRVPNGKGGFHQINLTGGDPISSMFAMAGNNAKFIESMFFDTGTDHFFESDSNFHEKFGDVANKKVNSLEAAQLTMGLILSFGENLTNSTYLAGASNFFEDVKQVGIVMSGDMSQEGLKKAGKQWSMKFAKGFIPNYMKKTASAVGFKSDYQKISTEWNTLIQSQLYDKNLPDRFTLFGEKKPKYGGYKNINLSDVQKEVYKIMPKLTRTQNTISMKAGNLQMTADEQSFYQFHAGTRFDSNVKNLIAQPGYQNSGKAIKKLLLKKALGFARTDAMKLVKSNGDVNDSKNQLNDGSFAPASNFFESIDARHKEIFLNKMIADNDGDPFKDESLIQLENSVNQQQQIIDNNQQ